MHIVIVEQFPPYRLSRSTFKENIIGHYYGDSAVHLEERLHMLQEVELLIGGSCLEVLTLVNQRFPVCSTFSIYDSYTASLAEGRIRKDHVVAVPRV